MAPFLSTLTRMKRILVLALVVLAACSSDKTSSGEPKEPWDDDRPADASLAATKVETKYGTVWVTENMLYAHDCDIIEKLDAKGLLESTVIPPRTARPGYICG